MSNHKTEATYHGKDNTEGGAVTGHGGASRVRAHIGSTAPGYPQPGPHSDAAHAAITAELVACTLGARSRPELALPA